jgi:hypothetical protein
MIARESISALLAFLPIKPNYRMLRKDGLPNWQNLCDWWRFWFYKSLTIHP